MNRQYIGARYVPKIYSGIGGSPEWVANIPYEALTIVTYLGNSYTSKVPVPNTIGTPIANPDYWAITGNYNEQIEAYRTSTENLRTLVNDTVVPDINTLKNKFPVKTIDITDNAIIESKIANSSITNDKIANATITESKLVNNTISIGKIAQAEKVAIRSNSTSIKKNVILIGDSYVHSDNGRHAFDEVMPTIASDWKIYTFADSGCGFTGAGAQGYNINDLINNAGSTLGVPNPDIDYIIVCAGRNEAGGIGSLTRPSSALGGAVGEAFANAHTKFPNAKVWLFPCLYDWRLPNSNLFKALSDMTYSASLQNVSIADGCWSWGIGDTTLYLYPSDIHPTLEGSQMMCRKIYSAVENNNPNCFRDRQDNFDNFAFYLNKAGIQIQGEATFQGTNNNFISNAQLPSWLQHRGDENWYFAGYNTVANTTDATMVGLIPEGLVVSGSTLMGNNQKCRLCVNLPYTL